MEKDLINAVKYLRKEMENDKEEILEALEALTEDIEDGSGEGEEAVSDNPFDDVPDTDPFVGEDTEDVPDYKGKRKVESKDKPVAKKKSWFSKNKGEKKPDVSQDDIDQGNY